MLIFGFWFVTEVSCQIIYGDIDRVFHIEENIRKMKDAELEAALKEDYADDDDDPGRINLTLRKGAMSHGTTE